MIGFDSVIVVTCAIATGIHGSAIVVTGAERMASGDAEAGRVQLALGLFLALFGAIVLGWAFGAGAP